MRRVYDIRGKVTGASGLLSWLVRGRPVEGFVIVDGSKEDFEAVAGRTFGVAGELTKAPMIGRVPISSRRFGRTEVAVESRSHCSRLALDGMDVSVVVEVSDDGKSLDRVEASAAVRSMPGRLWLSEVEVSGKGVMTLENA